MKILTVKEKEFQKKIISKAQLKFKIEMFNN